MTTLLLVAFAYLIGSIPTGYWVVLSMTGIDLRKVGSGSTGTTNVLRTAGKKAAAFVFVVDIFKGILPVWMAIYAIEHNMLPELEPIKWLLPWVPPLAGITSMIGHSKSIFLNFQGGKSAATGCGTLIGCNTIAGLASLAFWGLVLAGVRIVSVASIAAAIACAVFMWIFTAGSPYQISFSAYAAIGGLYVIIRHKANIQRLLKKQEPKIGQKLETQPQNQGTQQ